ncbi:hypothetical protein NQ318_001486 [Aromia moschata]|uniref:SCP domain-containing protein n=1 Tax=Aromia moschata TaxID=1265417 RepID=A0AAV8XBV4_9CUCU|nr:hypothetical protein NQ318_001486 [Aromia moschata]
MLIEFSNQIGVKVGHYTQLVWAESTEVGCAVSYYSTSSENRTWYHVLFVCNYGPAGNYVGQPMYKVGKPCSKCPKGLKQNKEYKGLCGTIRDVNETQGFNNTLFS